MWAKHQSDQSVDSFSSDLSLPQFEPPGLSDKMLESAADYQGMPLTAITVSPSASEAEDAPSYVQQSSFESAPPKRFGVVAQSLHRSFSQLRLHLW
jgi:hypothetical protein